MFRLPIPEERHLAIQKRCARAEPEPACAARFSYLPMLFFQIPILVFSGKKKKKKTLKLPGL